ncbi:hypothetical protein FIBSPDRAFT_1048210 [Athelia psychrophila]|uniref:Uncharacterized protein n=1 Tax=Athelia psychrophila TaxID=1759441 RepID=A0A166E0T7_9AGAM|nr:hypothetical protein FIBSPDRAFT_1048210 [Fibularhizoctonia sp. CBS 109695]
MAANPNAAPLEAPMDSYSPSELEEVVLQRSAVEPGWLAPNSPASMATIPYAGRFLHLVEGGRWLLSSEDGSVIVYDLDNIKTPGQPIIPEYAGMPVRQRTLELSVDVLRDTSTFTFNIAIEQCSDQDDIPSWTHLWQVTMHGCGINAELRAIHLKSFTTPGLF